MTKIAIKCEHGFLASPEWRAHDLLYTSDPKRAARFGDKAQARQAMRAFASVGKWRSCEVPAFEIDAPKTFVCPQCGEEWTKPHCMKCAEEIRAA